MAPPLLRSLEYSLCLLSVMWDNLHSLPFDDGFFILCPQPKLLWFSRTLLFCINRSNSCWCIPPCRFDTHLGVSFGRFPWWIPVDAVCGWSVPNISSALATFCFSWNCKLHFLQRHFSDQVYKFLQRNFILLYVIVQRVKVSVAVLTDFELLPCQTVIIQWRNFNQEMYTNFKWI